MKASTTSHLRLRLQTWLFVILFTGIIGMLAWLSTQYVYQTDWSVNNRNTVSDDTRQLLAQLNQPITITAFAREEKLLRKQIQHLIGRYQRFYPDIQLAFVNPDAAPERVRSAGIKTEGELIVSYAGRSEHVSLLNEAALTNTLMRISRSDDRWVVFVSGHGERNPSGEANHDLGTFGSEMERQGLRVQQLNLVESAIPENTQLLVVAGPRLNLLDGEITLLKQYIEDGGNLLWLAEPHNQHGMTPIAELLGIEFLPGLIVDASTQLFGIDNPSFVIVSTYPNHDITREMNSITVFPETAAIAINDNDGDSLWQATPLLTTNDRSWTELDELVGEIGFDEDGDERAGPLNLGVALMRELEENDSEEISEQRIVVIGDGDFLSNTYLGNGGNLSLGLNSIHWLVHDEDLIDIRIKSAPDTTLELSKTAQITIAFSFLVGLPLFLLTCGIVIWVRRRRR